METHAHHIHKAPGQGWKHYFFEFLMLFIAVFSGFLAENLREHFIETKRAKEYIHSLVEDLKTDTTRLNRLINLDDEKIAALNNMTDCYNTVMKDPKATSCTGTLIKHSKSNLSFAITDRTIRQLANAGGFRILGTGDADSIISYENAFKIYENFQSTLYQSTQDNVRNTLNQLADFRVNAPLQNFVPGQGAIDTCCGKLQGPLLFSEDRALLNKWFNELVLYLRVTNGQRFLLDRLRSKATNLIEYYKSRHHLE